MFDEDRNTSMELVTQEGPLNRLVSKPTCIPRTCSACRLRAPYRMGWSRARRSSSRRARTFARRRARCRIAWARWHPSRSRARGTALCRWSRAPWRLAASAAAASAAVGARAKSTHALAHARRAQPSPKGRSRGGCPCVMRKSPNRGGQTERIVCAHPCLGSGLAVRFNAARYPSRTA